MARTTRPDAAALPATFRAPAGAVTAARAATRGAPGVPRQRARRVAPSAPAPSSPGSSTTAPVPLGSVVTAPGGLHAAACAECAGTAVTRLAMTLGDGSPVTFVSCHECEARGWFAVDGAALALDAVLGSARRG